MNKIKKLLICITGLALGGVGSIFCLNSDKLLLGFEKVNQIEYAQQDNSTQTTQGQQETPKIENETKEEETQETESDTKKQETPKTENEKSKTENNIKVDKQSTEQSQNKPNQEKKSVKKSQTVYITETGKCYHKSWCKHLRQSKIAIDKKKAHKEYRPCKDCRP